jgi:hypothetical protein
MNKIGARFAVSEGFGTHDERMVSFLNFFLEGDLGFYKIAGFLFALWKHFEVSEFVD